MRRDPSTLVTLVVVALTLGARPLLGDAAPARPYQATAHAHQTPRTDGVGAVRSERLRYRATWNALPVADAELLVQPGPHGTVSLRGRAETNEVLDLLWRMRDSVEATVRVQPVAPERFVLRQNENDRHRETTVVAKPPRLLGTVERRHRRPRRAEVALAPNLHDPASVAYLIRTLAADLKGPRSFDVLAGTKIYTLTVTPAGTENVDAAERTWPARRFHVALQLVPKDVESREVDPAGDDERREERWHELKVQEADLWVSAGAERIPLRMQSRTFWGWVTVELVGRGAFDYSMLDHSTEPSLASATSP